MQRQRQPECGRMNFYRARTCRRLLRFAFFFVCARGGTFRAQLSGPIDKVAIVNVLVRDLIYEAAESVALILDGLASTGWNCIFYF